ncbi:MAG: hypothetical protein QOC92_3057 [Acidimicrobiaceae bacterium]|nr:hypothetical protein [Frankiaceae bacterium]
MSAETQDGPASVQAREPNEGPRPRQHDEADGGDHQTEAHIRKLLPEAGVRAMYVPLPLTLRWIGGLAHPLQLLANGQTQVCLEQWARWTLQMRDPTIATVHATQTTGTITGVTPGTTVLTASAVPLNGTGPSSPYRISVNVSR